MSSSNENYNSDELEAPAWLNEEFFIKVLNQHLEETKVEVIDIKISPATAKGDHYASVMFRACVTYLTQKGKSSKSLIIKTMPELEGHKKEFFAQSQIFPTEIAMYTEMLPKFEEILRSVGDETIFCARCIYHSLDPRQVMVFEDLVPQGYDVIRNRSATLEELKGALGKLGKWHAVSYKLLKEQPELFDKLQYDCSTVSNMFEQKYMTRGLPDFIDMLGTVESLKKYQKYFEPMRDNFIKRWIDILREYRENRRESGYYVLCHGDFHLANLMFKGNNCMLLDFQISYVGSMANDVINAFYMLLSPEDRREKSDELIYHFFETFRKTLSKIGYNEKVPTLIEFRRHLFEQRYTELMLLAIYFPCIIYMRKGLDPGELMKDDKVRVQTYYDKDYQQDVEYLLPRMLHLGYFEDD